MESLILCGIYLAELTCYYFGLRILFEVKQKSRVWMITGILLPVIIGMIPMEDASWKNVLVTIGVIVVMFLSIEGRAVENGVKLILFNLLFECINSVFTRLSEKILVSINEDYTDIDKYFILKCFIAICIFMLNLVKDRLKKYKETRINSIVYFIIGFIAISMLICLGIFSQIIIYLPDKRFVFLYNFLNITILFSIVFLAIFVIYIKNTHERMEQLLETERLLKDSQVNYYKQILKKETDTRKYRHDMINHLVYLDELLSKNRTEDTRKYLSSILGGFKKIQNTYYATGNEMADTIMNYYFGMLPKDVKIDIIGRIPIEIDMEDTDICTIFSNIFQNAVEEITENKIKDAKIIIKVQKGKAYAEYDIKNSLSREINETQIDKNGLPESHKSDRRNHGIGMTNIKHTIERNHGNFHWYQEEGYFCINIIIPIKYNTKQT